MVAHAIDAAAGVLGIVGGWSCVTARERSVGFVTVAVMNVAAAVGLAQLLVLVVSVAGLSDLKQQRSRTSVG